MFETAYFVEREHKTMSVLSDLKKGEFGYIEGLELDGNIRRRLQDIGFVKGSRIECVGKSPLGDPCAYLIKGALIAIRKEHAAHIILEGSACDL